MKEELVSCLDDLENFAKKISKKIVHKNILLSGCMGSGKTTFVKSLSKFLGCTSVISSPTFSIVNEINFGKKIGFHMDLYRIKTINELLDIGFLDYIAKAEYCFIEWPEQVIDVFSNDYHLFEFKIVEETIRKIIFK